MSCAWVDERAIHSDDEKSRRTSVCLTLPDFGPLPWHLATYLVIVACPFSDTFDNMFYLTNEVVIVGPGRTYNVDRNICPKP
jgi:hypothetical protein